MCGDTSSTPTGTNKGSAKYHFLFISGLVGLLLAFGDPASSDNDGTDTVA
jgi:hypothetical protein